MANSPASTSDLPSADEADFLAHRKAEIEAFLAPGGQAVADPVSAVLIAMPSRAATAGDATAMRRLFAEDLGDLPYLAVALACKDFRLGKAGDGHWAPTAAEIRARAIEHIRPAEKELGSINEVLEFVETAPHAAASPKTSRETIAAGFAKLRKEIGIATDPFAPRRTNAPADVTRAEAQAALDRMEAEGPWAPPLSDESRGFIRPATRPIETDDDFRETLR